MEFYNVITSWFILLFDEIWTGQPTSIAADNYEIIGGLTWTGTNYWATNGRYCLPPIHKEIDAVAVNVRNVTAAVLDRLEHESSAGASLEKAAAWIGFYRGMRGGS
jgi:hypothetical protein